MGIVASSLCLACQGVSCACSMMKCCFSSARGPDGLSNKAAKLMYILMLGIATVVAIILRYNGDKMNLNFYGAFDIHCSNGTEHNAVSVNLTPNVGGSVQDHVDKLLGKTLAPTPSFDHHATYVYCKGDAAVYRISFMLAIFFGVIGALSSMSNAFHRGYWGVKIGGFLVALVVCFLIPNNVFDNSGYAWVARIASMLFLLLQILALIDFGYQWNEDWVNRADGDADGAADNKWLYGILGSASLMYLGSIIGIVYMFMKYDECGFSVALNALTLCCVVGFTGLSLFRDKLVGEEFQGAILPAAVVTSYCVYLCWSALESHPSKECKPARAEWNDNTKDMAFGIIIATVSLMWTTYSASRNAQELISGEKSEVSDAEIREPLYRVARDDGGDEEYGTAAADMRRDNMEALEIESHSSAEIDLSTEGLWVFHLMMMTASMYMAMLLTNWGANENQSGNQNGQVGLASMWVKTICLVATAGLYVWTLVAPSVLPDRDWN